MSNRLPQDDGYGYLYFIFVTVPYTVTYSQVRYLNRRYFVVILITVVRPVNILYVGMTWLQSMGQDYDKI